MSAAVSCCPSVHFTSSRMSKVHVLPSSDVSHFVASSGCGDMSFIEYPIMKL